LVYSCFVTNEYGSPGSAYPKTEPVLIKRSADGEIKVVVRPIPLKKHIGNSLNTGVLSLFQGSYDLTVLLTPGGEVNLLAIASFIMLILAVYTANLVAILNTDSQKTSVVSIEAAIRMGYSFCAERHLANTIIGTYRLDPDRIVPDAVEIGGDGKLGFICPHCKARERTLAMMKRTHNDPSMYCNAAVTKIEDLQVMHRDGKHCDKTKVWESLGQVTIGLSIFDAHAPALSSLFHKRKGEGAMEKVLRAGTSESQCPVPAEEGSALDPQQLTGIWVVTFGLALIGLLLRCIISLTRRCLHRGGSGDGDVQKERKLQQYDKWLNPLGYDVIMEGYRFDSENDELIRIATGDIPSSDKQSNNVAIRY
jgi:hypothetical protein